MTMSLHLIYFETATEAARAASAPCQHTAVNDGRRLDPASTLAEGCVR